MPPPQSHGEFRSRRPHAQPDPSLWQRIRACASRVIPAVKIFSKCEPDHTRSTLTSCRVRRRARSQACALMTRILSSRKLETQEVAQKEETKNGSRKEPDHYRCYDIVVA